MKANNYAIKITFPLTIVSLTLAILGKVCLSWDEFLLNILLGVFGSSLVTLAVSVTNYCVERRKSLETFLICGRKIIKNFRKFPTDFETNEAANIILEINSFDYTDFDNAFAEISFINRNALHKRIYNELYVPIVNARGIIQKAAKHIEQCSRSKIMEEVVENVDNLFNSRTTIEIDGVSITQCKRIIVEELTNKFNGFYYDCIYPKALVTKRDKGDASD